MRNSILALRWRWRSRAAPSPSPTPPQLDLPAPTATAEQNALLARWWTAFDDPVLTALIDEAFANNLDLQVALARIEAARADVLLAQSNLAPSINLRARRLALAAVAEHGAGGRVRHSRLERLQRRHRNVVRARHLGQVSERRARGRQRSRRTRSTIARRCASRSPPTSRTRTSACARPTHSWSCSRTRGIRGPTRSRCSSDRFDGGIIGEYDLRQAEAELSAVVADIARARAGHRPHSRRRIATLTGRSPRAVFTPEIARGATIEAATAVPQLPSGLPSGLLERRPDIRRAEAELAASDLRIQQARADYFPNLALTGALGTESASLSSLFTLAGDGLALRSRLVQPILALKAIEAPVDCRHRPP